MTKLAGLLFYLEGREDAAQDFDVDEFDAVAIARGVRALDDIRPQARRVIEEDLKTDQHDGTKDDWIADHQDEIENARVTDEQAYAAWCLGYVDEASVLLEAEVATTLADEDTAVETPAAKSMQRSRSSGAAGAEAIANPSCEPTTYATYYQQGVRDCQNTFSARDMDPEINNAVLAFQKHRQDVAKLAMEAVKTYWAESADESKTDWLQQNADEVREEGLKPDRAYEFWADGWRMQAQRFVAEKIVERAAD